ncbi:E3 ubiquitin-protein ligase arih1 [Hondaea fermentalgiana]|uniref:RBR-type E3 ubiquitin transferase n=1 Tax=Hondaea fermentalgiana TaxID=2315210 RepID=A0A2R5GB74_9STRA|nr:E3 ubiquitin-protein ligase arih1 [Hondaea fermentalgiana]|eukprot:GBG28256.1 E3 ubiquitin-protein ligase arih1 [Hondaea fermentalgiana]
MMLMGNNGGDGDDVDPESVLETENGPREEPRTPVPAASTELLLRELGNVKMRGRVRKLPKYLSLSQMVEERMPTKVGVLQVMRFAGRRSAIWQNQLLVLCGNTIAIFPTTYGPEDEEVLTRIFREKKSARRKLRSETHFDLSEPDLSVSVALSAAVHRQPGEIATAQDSQHSYEWTISVPRYRGLLLVRLRSPTAEDRDQWVSALRAFESRVSTSFSAFRPKSLSVETSQNSALLQSRKGAPNGSALRSPRSPALRKVHSEARFDAAALHTIKKIATPPKDEKDETFTSDIIRAMQDRFSSASDYIVYSDQEKIVARRQDVTNCLADYLVRTSHEHSYTPDQTVAEEILRDHDWNLRAAMLAVLQAPSPRDTSRSTTQDTPDTSLHVTTCAICFENFGVDESNEDPSKEAASLRCGHAFCRGCWTANISCRIRDGKACLCTECMAPGCRERATAAFVRQHAESDELRERFDRLYADAFVDSCETVRWCPQSGCGNAVEWKLAEDTNTSQSTATSAKHETDMCARSVHCSCGFKFCFDCGSESHAPATCEQVEAWHQVLVAAEEARQVKAAPRKEQEQVMAKRWILNNARPCPKCKVPIEKMQGCNHMVCSSCKHEYCWACLGPWTDHSTETGGFFRCKIADERTDEVLARQDAARTAMQQDFAQTRDRALEERKRNAEQEEAFRKANQLRKRVAHFVKQYDQHDAIAQWAKNVSQDFDRALENETQILGPQRALVDFLQKILRVLADCRAMLKWVVVVSYFLNAESSTAANWVFGLDELKERLPLTDAVSIDGPHRALFAAKLGACVQLADRLQHAVEGPALSIGLDDANATRAKLWKKSPWARQRVRKALELATVLAPLQTRQSLFKLTSRAIRSPGICNSPRTWRQNSTQTHDASMRNLIARHDAETDQDEDVDEDDDLTLVDDEDDLESSSGTGLTYFQQHPTPRNQRRVSRRPRAGAFDGAMQSPERRRIDFTARGIANRTDNTNDSDSESMVSLDDDAVANPPRVYISFLAENRLKPLTCSLWKNLGRVSRCSLDDLRESENDGELRLHVEELNELQQRFRDSLQIVVLQSEHKGKLWRKRSRAEKAQALRQTRQAMETLDVEFQMSRPLAVDGPDTLALLKHLKAQSQNPLDIGSKFSTYFVLDATGCFHCRRSGIFPMQLEAELESLCCVTGLFSYVESADQA